MFGQNHIYLKGFFQKLHFLKNSFSKIYFSFEKLYYVKVISNKLLVETKKCCNNN